MFWMSRKATIDQLVNEKRRSTRTSSECVAPRRALRYSSGRFEMTPPFVAGS